MRTTTSQRDTPLPFVGSMAWVAIASFAAGFAGFLLFGLAGG